jgi:hypothetical protein
VLETEHSFWGEKEGERERFSLGTRRHN